MAEIDSLVKVHATVFYPELTGQNTVSHNVLMVVGLVAHGDALALTFTVRLGVDVLTH